MSVCIWCHKEIRVKLQITDLFSFRAINTSACCSECVQLFERINKRSCCIKCFRPMDKQGQCVDCKKWERLYPELSLKHQALFSYNAFAKEWMERFKFSGDTRMATMIAPELKRTLEKKRKTHDIIILPVSDRSLQERGFNQVEVLLKEAGISYTDILMNKSKEEKQSKKNYQERMRMKQPFEWQPAQYNVQLKDQVLLIDDVYTTGRTMLYAIEKLKEAGTKQIESFSLFR